MTEKILIIKHGAFGDIIQAIGPMQAIRRHHKDAKLVILTSTPYRDFLMQTGLFDDVIIDDRPSLWTLKWRGLRRQITEMGFNRVYDLQNSDRTGFYFRMLKTKPDWNGIAAGCSHPQPLENRTQMHNIDRLNDQIKRADVKPVKTADFSWLGNDKDFKFQQPYAIFIAGASQGKNHKRWPYFVELANRVLEKGVLPVFIGGNAERNMIPEIEQRCARAEIFIGKTSFDDLADLGRGASFFIGNDTGPSHLMASLGVKGIVLFAESSQPHRCAPKGKHITSVIVPSLQTDLTVQDVLRKTPF